MLIVGLSGTGKTTTTFTRQNDSKPVQDDFVALYPGGRVVATENGCFAKTFSLDPAFEPSHLRCRLQARGVPGERLPEAARGRWTSSTPRYTQNGRRSSGWTRWDGTVTHASSRGSTSC